MNGGAAGRAEWPPPACGFDVSMSLGAGVYGSSVTLSLIQIQTLLTIPQSSYLDSGEGVEQQGDGQPLEPETGRKGIMPRQMCYAKLELASSRDHRGRKLNKTQYAETLDMLKKSRADRKAQQGVPGVPASNSLSRTLPSFLESGDLEPSELYASVRMAKAEGKAQRLEYVNKESLKI
ncbi:uncharacterized protein LOC144487199 isoform X2 [Mustelus asterias]